MVPKIDISDFCTNADGSMTNISAMLCIVLVKCIHKMLYNTQVVVMLSMVICQFVRQCVLICVVVVVVVVLSYNTSTAWAVEGA